MELDQYLRKRRMEMVIPKLRPKTTVLDIGCYDGEFLTSIRKVITDGYGIDPLVTTHSYKNLRFIEWTFENFLPFRKRMFDDIFMLATLEHIKNKKDLAEECYRVLKKDGRVIMTVPSPKADVIIELLMKLHILDEEDFFRQHCVPTHTEILNYFISAGFNLDSYMPFEFHLNNVYVFSKGGK